MMDESSKVNQTADVEKEMDAQKILEGLRLHVIGEGEDGEITVFSESSGKKTVLRTLTQVKTEKLVQLCGETAMQFTETVGLPAIRSALAQAAYQAKRLSGDSIRRQGIWETADESFAVVADGAFGKWNGTTFVKSATPLEDGVFYDTTSARWRIDFDQLKHDLEQFDRNKSREVFERFRVHLNYWIWTPGDPERNAKIARIVAALFVATFVQTIWNWRPQVSISGESHSGKSTLFDFFQRIFGNLAVGLEKSTPAGLRQALHSSASPCLMDEFENDEHRSRLLDLIKTSGCGATVVRGTANQKGMQYRVQHIFWVAAIEDGIREVASINRFIRFALHKPTEGIARLKLPSRSECAEFHRFLLATAIYYGATAKKLVEELVNTVQLNVDARIIENFAVPVAMASLIFGEEADAESILREALELIPLEREFGSDHDELLATILESHLRVPETGIFSIKQCIVSVLSAGQDHTDKHHALKLSGIRVVIKEQPQVFFGPRLIERFLLKGTPWKGKNLKMILRRIPGATESQQRFDDARDRAIVVPISELERFWVTSDSASELQEVEE